MRKPEINGALTAHTEQASGLSEINVAMNQLDQVTQHNTAMFEETTAASHALTKGAQALAEAAAQFRTGRTVAEAPARPQKVLAADLGQDSAPEEPPRFRTVREGNTVKHVAPEDTGWDGF